MTLEQRAGGAELVKRLSAVKVVRRHAALIAGRRAPRQSAAERARDPQARRDGPSAAMPLATKALGAEPDATAPDGTAVRLLLALAGGSLAHFELPAGAVSHAVTHRTVEEIWYVVSGRGALWRRAGGRRASGAGARRRVTIPLGTRVPVPRRGRRPARLRRGHHAALAGNGRGGRG